MRIPGGIRLVQRLKLWYDTFQAYWQTIWMETGTGAVRTDTGAAGRRYGYIPVAILCNILWGSAIPFINIGYRLFGIGAGESGTQILFAGCRFFLAGCITVLIRSLTLGRAALPQKRNLPSVLKLAATQTIGQYVLFYIGVAHTASVKASIITGLGAFVSILIASYVFHYETMDRRKWIGGILGILGVIVMNFRPGALGGSVTLAGEGALLLSMISCAVSAGQIKRYSQTEDPVTLNGWQFMVGGAVMILLGLLCGGRLHPQGAGAVLVLMYLACLSAAAYSLWAMLLKTCPISKIAVFMFLQPLFGVILGIVLVRQKMDLPPAQYLAALALVCACIIVIQHRSEEQGGLPV